MKRTWIFIGMSCLILSVALITISSAQERGKNAQAAERSTEQLSHSPEGSVLFGNETLGGATTSDLVRLKCKGKSNISADVLDAGPFFDNGFQVTVVCHKPKDSTASATSATVGGLAPSAVVSDCKEALITFTCYSNTFCDDEYNSFITCGANDIKSLDFLQDQ